MPQCRQSLKFLHFPFKRILVYRGFKGLYILCPKLSKFRVYIRPFLLDQDPFKGAYRTCSESLKFRHWSSKPWLGYRDMPMWVSFTVIWNLNPFNKKKIFRIPFPYFLLVFSLTGAYLCLSSYFHLAPNNLAVGPDKGRKT